MPRNFTIRLARLLTCIWLLGLSVLAPSPATAQEDPWFTIDALNPGLGAPPADLDRSTPRSAMAAFLRAAEAEDWDRAAHLIDLGGLPEEEQDARGPLLARQLNSLIERKAILNWGELNDRPDALQVVGGQDRPQAGEPRRSILIRDLALDPAPGAIRLERVRPGEDADPEWVFSRRTVADLPALYERYGPSEFEARLPEALTEEAVWGLMWWELLGIPIVLVTAVLLGLAVHRALSWGHRHLHSDLGRRIAGAVSAPLIIAAVTSLVWWLSSAVFVFSGQIDVFLAPAIAIGFVTATLLFIVNAVEAALDHLVAPGADVDLTRRERAESRALATRLNAGKRVLVVVVFLIGAGVVLATADVFRSIGLSLLASAGALTLVLGFAARNVLGNVMSSLQIAINQSAKVGDRVVYKGELCHVERIHMTFVQLRNWDGTRLVVPVEEFVSETFHNWSMQEPEMLRILKLKFSPQADISKLREIFLDVLDGLSKEELGEELGDMDEGAVNVAGQDVFGVDVWFNVPCRDPNTSWEVACNVREELLARARDLERESGTPVFPEAVAADAA